MILESVLDEAFRTYGSVPEGYETAPLLEAMRQIPLPESGTAYRASMDELERAAIFPALESRFFGGMPAQLGMCWGHNTKLNCLEYHRCSEVNIGAEPFILLLARLQELEAGVLDTDKVRAFLVPAGVPVELYADTLHFAPCQTSEDGFRVAVALLRGTNTEKPAVDAGNDEDRRLWARNKWLLAHPESRQAQNGAYIGLSGRNIDIREEL